MTPRPLLFALLVSATPVCSAAQSSQSDDPCWGSTTPQVNACMSAKLAAAEDRMNRYHQQAIARFLEAGDDATVLGIRLSQRAFVAYRDTECETVHEHWKEGTIRTAMELGCSIALTDQRTHTIWANWLTYADSTPPLLPEPKPGG